MKRSKLFSTFLALVFSSGVLCAQSQDPSGADFQNISQIRVSLANHLKARFLGVRVTYTNRQSEPMGEGTPTELITTNDGYFFGMLNDDQSTARVQILFEASNQLLLRESTLPKNIHQREMQEQISVERFINSSLQPLLSETDALTESTKLPTDVPTTQRIADLKSGEEISYLDIDTGEKKKGLAVVIDDRILLNDGTPLMIRFERQ